MNIAQRLRTRSRLAAGIILSASILLTAACQPIVDPDAVEAEGPAQEETVSSAEALFEVEPAKATVNTRSLRVRKGPSDSYDLVAGVRQNETYGVLAMTSDGAWIQLAVDRAPEGEGWVSTEFVTLEGDITSIPTVPAEESAETAAEAEESEETGATTEVPAGAVQALIETPLPLRVRSAPTTEVENKIGNVFDGETYPVLELSGDGLWVKIDVPELADDGGWISAEYVTLEGDIANLPSAQPEEPVASEDEVAEAADEPAADAETESEAETPAESDVDAEPEAAAEEPEAADAEEAEAGDEELAAIGQALIETPLPLRVRSAPTEEEDNKIGNVFDGETYPVLEFSEDGLWVKIDVPELAEDGGWVSAEYVIIEE